jgi:3-oxoacyl-[acyl-carrier-protein] synthase III
MDAYLNFIDYFLPADKLTNEMINSDHPEWSADKISQKTGIYSRSIAGENEFASDLAISAAKNLFDKVSIKPGEFDFLLYCTQSPDYFLPTTACILQDKLGLPNSAGALDYNLGCSGYIYGLSLAKGILKSEQSKRLALITSETYSKYIHPRDKGNKTIFGDAASISVLSDSPGGDISAKIRDFSFYTDGKGFDKLIVKNGGIRNRIAPGLDEFDQEGMFLRNDSNLYMDGKAIFDFTSFIVPPLIEKVLEKNNLSRNDIDLYVFHQANAFMMQTVRKRCQIPEDKFFIHLKDCGNTVSNTIPIALKEASRQNRINSGMKVLLAGFGVGLSAAACVIEIM